MTRHTTPANRLKTRLPWFVIAFAMSISLLDDFQSIGVAKTILVAAALSGLFQVIFDPLLASWRRNFRTPLFLPHSLVFCALMAGWSLLGLVLPQAYSLAQSSTVSNRTLTLLKSVDLITFELVTQVGLSWFLGVLTCLWVRRRCASETVKAQISPYRLSLSLLCLVPVTAFSGWLLQLWWYGSQLDSGLRSFCTNGGYGDTKVCAIFVSAIAEIDAPAYRSDPDAPRPICAAAISEMPQRTELLKWPERAAVNDRWRQYRESKDLRGI